MVQATEKGGKGGGLLGDSNLGIRQREWRPLLEFLIEIDSASYLWKTLGKKKTG